MTAARCTTCGTPLDAKTPYRPFCSDRCRLLDLGRWLDEEYKVAGESAVAFDEDLGEDHAGPFGGAWRREESSDERDA